MTETHKAVDAAIKHRLRIFLEKYRLYPDDIALDAYDNHVVWICLEHWKQQVVLPFAATEEQVSEAVRSVLGDAVNQAEAE